MVGYRRNKPGNPDDIFFFSIVTNGRYPWFSLKPERDTVKSAMDYVHGKYKLVFKAWVILPDHLHLLLKSPKADYSLVLWNLKLWLTCAFRRTGKLVKGNKMWQDRFWEETVKDDDHYERCVNYIHYNPVKHGLVRAPFDWEHSSIHGYFKKGLILRDWGDSKCIDISGAEYD